MIQGSNMHGTTAIKQKTMMSNTSIRKRSRVTKTYSFHFFDHGLAYNNNTEKGISIDTEIMQPSNGDLRHV